VETATQALQTQFDANYAVVENILRPESVIHRGMVIRPDLGAFVALDGAGFKGETKDAQANVKFYSILLQEFSMLREEVRRKLALEVHQKDNGLVISTGKYHGSDPAYARHSLELVLSNVFDVFQAKIDRVEYDQGRRRVFGMPSLAHAAPRQVDSARMFAYMHLGLAQQYLPLA
jgi:hypothetical protein